MNLRKLRNILNIAFMLLAVAAIHHIVFRLQQSSCVFSCILAVFAIVLKMAESIIQVHRQIRDKE
jgi:succinate-acetate transporter protein